jgi:AraC-like DNA-binding protein
MIYGRYAKDTSFSMGHAHDTCEFGVYLTESVHTTINGRVHVSQHGSALFIPPNVFHQLSEPPNFVFSVFYFCFDPGHFLNRGMLTVSKLVNRLCENNYTACFGQGEKYIHLIQPIIKELDAPGIYWDDKLTALAANILIEFARDITVEFQNQQDQPLLAKLCDTISQSPQTISSLDRAAHICHMSRTVFMQKFKSFTGMTFIEFVHSARLNKAIQLLETTSLSITEVALKCGFENLGHFHAVFRRAYDTTPLQYRIFFQQQQILHLKPRKSNDGKVMRGSDEI